MEIEPLVLFNEYDGRNNFSTTSYVRKVLQESLPKMTIIVSSFLINSYGAIVKLYRYAHAGNFEPGILCRSYTVAI